jgi:hypothetical protein
MNCGTVTCHNEPTVLAFWPGKDTPMCPSCYARGVAIADIMGFRLHSMPIEASHLYQQTALDAAARLVGKIEPEPGKE